MVYSCVSCGVVWGVLFDCVLCVSWLSCVVSVVWCMCWFGLIWCASCLVWCVLNACVGAFCVVLLRLVWFVVVWCYVL